jgi:hypothetical protein
MLFTPERVAHLKKEIKAAGEGQPGHTRSAPEHARALLHLEELIGLPPTESVIRTLSFDPAVKSVAEAEVMSPVTLRRITSRYDQRCMHLEKGRGGEGNCVLVWMRVTSRRVLLSFLVARTRRLESPYEESRPRVREREAADHHPRDDEGRDAGEVWRQPER